MSVRKINKADWPKYFNDYFLKFLKDKQPEYVELRVLSKDSGSQPEIEWTPLRGISYDPRNDLLDLSVDKLDHLIYHPVEIYVDDEEDGMINSMEITKKEGDKEIIEVR